MKRKAEEQDASEGEGARNSSNQDLTHTPQRRGPLGVLGKDGKEMLIHHDSSKNFLVVDVDIIWDEII